MEPPPRPRRSPGAVRKGVTNPALARTAPRERRHHGRIWKPALGKKIPSGSGRPCYSIMTFVSVRFTPVMAWIFVTTTSPSTLKLDAATSAMTS